MADFYSLLGLQSKQPSEAELKKAYKKAALKHHPDKNPQDRQAAERRFKRVAEAFAVLSDPQKKQIYDTYGEEGLKQGPPPQASRTAGGFPAEMFGGGFPQGVQFQSFSFGPGGGGGGGQGLEGVDPYDLFAQLFAGQMGPGGFGRPVDKPDEVKHQLMCSLEELYTGRTRRIKVTRELLDAQTGRPMRSQKVLEVGLKKGWKPGTKLRFEGEGDERRGKPAQDVVFVIQQKPHRYFERRGDDLHYNAQLTMAQASKGVKVTVPTLDGRSVRVEQPAGIRDNSSCRVTGEGMPTRAGAFGDLVVNFRVASAA